MTNLDDGSRLPDDVPEESFCGISPVSGQPLMVSADDGLTYLSFHKALGAHILGTVPVDGREYPDIVFYCPLGNDEVLGTYVSSYVSTSSDGNLVYGTPFKIGSTPWPDNNYKNCIYRLVAVGSKVYAFYLHQSDAKLYIAEYYPDLHKFSSWKKSIYLEGMSHYAMRMNASERANGTVELIFLCLDGTAVKPDSDPNESLYDRGGIYKGNLGNSVIYRVFLDSETWEQKGPAEKLSGEQNVIVYPGSLLPISDNNDELKGVLVSNPFGCIKYFGLGKDVSYVYSVSDQTLKMPSSTWSVHQFGHHGDFISSGEGLVFHSRFTGNYTSDGAPVYEEPIPVLMQAGAVYSGSLCVPTVVDWDGDGADDIIAGNSEGRLLFYKNFGTNKEPGFGRGRYLKSGGEEICFRAGYNEIQGPSEAMWGYLCPNVIDWNGDGLLDIVFSSNEGKYEVMFNNGDVDCLGLRQSLELDGLELYGMWRVRPAVAMIGNHAHILTVDENDALHLYRKAGLTSVTDCGTIKLSDGKEIFCHNDETARAKSAWGRLKLELTDWDADGDLDLLVGTPWTSSLPSSSEGLPYHYKRNGTMQTLYFENIGSDEKMMFAYPVLFQFRGNDFNIGTHSNAPVACRFGNVGKKPNLLVGSQSGEFYFFDRYDLTYYYKW